MSPRDSRQRGYSLIEVLVAFAILAMALTVLLRIFSGGLRNIDASSEYTRALVVAEAELAVPGILEPMQSGFAEGTTADGFKWQRQVSALDLGGRTLESPLSPWRIAVEVQWPSGRGTRAVQLETIRLGEAGHVAGAIER